MATATPLGVFVLPNRFWDISGGLGRLPLELACQGCHFWSSPEIRNLANQFRCQLLQPPGDIPATIRSENPPGELHPQTGVYTPILPIASQKEAHEESDSDDGEEGFLESHSISLVPPEDEKEDCGSPKRQICRKQG